MNGPRTGTKLARMLGLFADGARLHRFEAERLGDHTLPSTVSRLASDFGLLFARCPEVLPEHGDAHVMRYWLPADQQARARALLGKQPQT